MVQSGFRFVAYSFLRNVLAPVLLHLVLLIPLSHADCAIWERKDKNPFVFHGGSSGFDWNSFYPRLQKMIEREAAGNLDLFEYIQSCTDVAIARLNTQPEDREIKLVPYFRRAVKNAKYGFYRNQSRRKEFVTDDDLSPIDANPGLSPDLYDSLWAQINMLLQAAIARLSHENGGDEEIAFLFRQKFINEMSYSQIAELPFEGKSKSVASVRTKILRHLDRFFEILDEIGISESGIDFGRTASRYSEIRIAMAFAIRFIGDRSLKPHHLKYRILRLHIIDGLTEDQIFQKLSAENLKVRGRHKLQPNDISDFLDQVVQDFEEAYADMNFFAVGVPRELTQPNEIAKLLLERGIENIEKSERRSVIGNILRQNILNGVQVKDIKNGRPERLNQADFRSGKDHLLQTELIGRYRPRPETILPADRQARALKGMSLALAFIEASNRSRNKHRFEILRRYIIENRDPQEILSTPFRGRFSIPPSIEVVEQMVESAGNDHVDQARNSPVITFALTVESGEPRAIARAIIHRAIEGLSVRPTPTPQRRARVAELMLIQGKFREEIFKEIDGDRHNDIRLALEWIRNALLDQTFPTESFLDPKADDFKEFPGKIDRRRKPDDPIH